MSSESTEGPTHIWPNSGKYCFTPSALKVGLGTEKEQGRIVLTLPQKIVSFNKQEGAKRRILNKPHHLEFNVY